MLQRHSPMHGHHHQHHRYDLYQQVGKDNPLAEYLALAEKKTGLSRNKLLAIGGTAGDSITITIIVTNILIIIIISRCCSGGWICSSASLRSHRLSLPSILFCQVGILYCYNKLFLSFFPHHHQQHFHYDHHSASDAGPWRTNRKKRSTGL